MWLLNAIAFCVNLSLLLFSQFFFVCVVKQRNSSMGHGDLSELSWYFSGGFLNVIFGLHYVCNQIER
jgi:hypothetical protein